MEEGQKLQAVTEINDVLGRYRLAVENGKIYLTVFPAPEAGQTLGQEDLLVDILKLHGEEIDKQVLELGIKEASGSPVVVASEAKAPEPKVQIQISKDRLEVSLDIEVPHGARPVTVEEIMARLQQLGVTYGIEHEEIKKIAGKQLVKMLCAKGLQPIEGANAYIKYYVELENKGRPAETDDGKVDFKNLNLFTVVQQDEVLAEKIPLTAGTPGFDVFGNEISPKPGKDIILPVGKNVQIIDDRKVTATMAGQLVVINNKLSVAPLIEIKGDVDLSTGNIVFMGGVKIQGSVQAGFSVKAEGNVDINGSVSGGTVEGRNINVKMGIMGMNRGLVKATENVVAKFVENATVVAGIDVLVNDVVLHSKISAGKRVIVEGKRGLIVGGQISAGEEIRAKVVGTPHATNTDLEVGVNPSLRTEYHSTRKEIKKAETELEQTQKALNLLRGMDQAKLSPDKHAMLLKLTKAQFHLIGQVETMRNRMTEIELAFEEMRFGRIKVADGVFAGVKITVGNLVKPIRDSVKFVSFYVEDGEIRTGSYK